MKIDKEKIIRANRTFGGNLYNPSNLDFDVEMANKQKNPFKSLAHVTRSMTSGHAFSDANKRTAGVVIKSELYNRGIKLDNKRLSRLMVNLAEKKESRINIIERKLRRVIRK